MWADLTQKTFRIALSVQKDGGFEAYEVREFQHRLGPKLTNYQISKKMHCSENTVALWLQRYKETGDVLDKEGQGRKPVTNERQDEMIHKAMLADPNQSSTEISEKMKRKGVAISPPSVRRRLIAQGWRYGKPMTKPLLSKMCIAKRG